MSCTRLPRPTCIPCEKCILGHVKMVLRGLYLDNSIWIQRWVISLRRQKYSLYVLEGWTTRVHGWWCAHQFTFPKWMIVDDNVLSKQCKGWHQSPVHMVWLIWSHTFISYLMEWGRLDWISFQKKSFTTHSKWQPHIHLSSTWALPCEQTQMN